MLDGNPWISAGHPPKRMCFRAFCLKQMAFSSSVRVTTGLYTTISVEDVGSTMANWDFYVGPQWIYVCIYIYRICSFILGPSRPHTFWVLCEMVVPRMPNTRCTKTYMSDGNGKKKQEVHQQSSIPFHPPVLIPPVDGALHAMLSRLGSSTISSTCTAKQPRLTSWHGKCSRNSTPIRSNPTFVSSFAACNGLQSIRSIKKKQKTITKNKEKRQTQNLQKARKNIMEGKSLTYLLKENSNW